MLRSVNVVVLTAILALTTFQAAGQCPTNVSGAANVVATPPAAPTTRATIRVSYSFTGNISNREPGFRIYKNGVLFKTQAVTAATGVYEYTDNPAVCDSTKLEGDFTYTAVPYLGQCPNAPMTSSSATISWDARPKIGSIDYSWTNKLTGEMSYTVGFAFPFFSDTQNNRIVYVNGSLNYVDGYPWNGSFTNSRVADCEARGMHQLTAQPMVCRFSGNILGVPKTVEYEVDPIKVTSLDLSVPDKDGKVKATVAYEFNGANLADYREMELLLDGVRVSGGFKGSLASNPGTADFTITVPCAGAGSYEVTARGIACEKPDSAFRHERVAHLNLPARKGVLDRMAARYVPESQTVAITGHYELPAGMTSATIIVTMEPTIGDGASETPTSSVNLTVNGTGGNMYSTSLPAPPSPIVMKITAKMESCGGVAEDSATIECPCNTKSTAPVFYTDGNMEYSDADPIAPLFGYPGLARAYDSNHQIRGSFGRGWRSPFDSRLFVRAAANGDTISLSSPARPSAIFIRRNGTYTQLSPKGENGTGTLTFDGATNLYGYRPPGANIVQLFQAGDGRFAGYRQLGTGHESRVTYANGLPATITDSWTGVTWAVSMDEVKNRVTSISAGGLLWQYAYDVDDNLQSVRAPGGALWRTYEYSNNRMTVARDGGGNVIEWHAYDAAGRAINSVGPSENIASIDYNAAGSTATRLITRVTAKAGATTDYVLEPAGGAWRTVQIMGSCASCSTHDTTYVYDDAGHVVREQDASGYITLNEYSSGRLTSVQNALRPADCDPETTANRCRVDPASLAAIPASLVVPTDATTTMTYEYNDVRWPERMTARTMVSILAPGQSRRETYSYHPLTGDTSNVTTSGFTMGANGTVVAQDRTTTVSLYGDDGALAPSFDPGGSFNPAWLALPQPAYFRKAVDGQRTDVSDITQFVYYPVDSSVPAHLRGHLAAVRNPLGHVTRYEAYDVFGNVTRVVDANGVATESTYDSLGRLLTTITKAVAGCDTTEDPLCGTDLIASRAYSPAAGPLERETRPGGGVTVYEYEARGRIRTVSRGLSPASVLERIEVQYDPLFDRKSAERLLSYDDGGWVEKKRETYNYDPEGRLHAVVHADDTSVGYSYDAAGRTASVRDENHVTPNTAYAYDPEGRLTRITQTLTGASGGVITTLYTYDRHGNLASVTDPNGNTTGYTYDDFGALVSQQSPVTGLTTYRYDSDANLTATVEANGATTTRAYDALGRVLSSTSTKPGVTDETVTWAYDNAGPGRFGIGRLAVMTDPAGTTTYAYDRRGLLRSEERAFRGGAGTAVIKLSHDADGNVAAVQYPSGGITQYTYDYAGRPLSASVPNGYTIVQSAAYLPFGPPTSRTYGNGTTQTMLYDSRYRITKNKLTGPDATIAEYNYTHDGVGNVTAILDTTDATFSRTFGYDDLNRLIAANTGTALWGTGVYSYDAMGNILSSALGDPSLTIHAKAAHFTYAGTTPRILTVRNNALPDPSDGLSEPSRPRVASHAVGFQTVTYDAAGNELSYVATRTYSPRNLLASVTDASEEPGSVHRVAYHYDGRGVRVIRSESQGNGTDASRYYTYSPDLQLLSVTNDDVANVWGARAMRPQALPGTRHEFIWFGGIPVLQQSSTFATGKHWYFTDHLGTPILQTDTTGSVVWRVEYEPFGDIWLKRVPVAPEEGPAPVIEQPLRFPGQEAASTWEGTEERYNIHRWYRPAFGRYTQSDPLLSTTNLYEYAQSSPVNATDPLGLVTFTWKWGPDKPKLVADPASMCRAQTKVACTKYFKAKLLCRCRCVNPTLFAPDVYLLVKADMYITNKPIVKGQAEDASIVDTQTAIDHEEKQHLNVAADKVEAWLRKWVKDASTLADCEATCKQVVAQSQRASELYGQHLIESRKNH